MHWGCVHVVAMRLQYWRCPQLRFCHVCPLMSLRPFFQPFNSFIRNTSLAWLGDESFSSYPNVIGLFEVICHFDVCLLFAQYHISKPADWPQREYISRPGSARQSVRTCAIRSASCKIQGAGTLKTICSHHFPVRYSSRVSAYSFCLPDNYTDFLC